MPSCGNEAIKKVLTWRLMKQHREPAPKLIGFLSYSSLFGSWTEGNRRYSNCSKRWLVDSNRGIVKYYLISTYEAHVTQHFRNIASHLSEPVSGKPVSLFSCAAARALYWHRDSSHFIQRIENDKMERKGAEQRT